MPRSRLSALVRFAFPVTLAAFSAAIATPRSARAQRPRTITLSAALTAARRANPDLVVARLREDSARGERAIAGALPNPTLGVIPNTPTQYSLTAPVDLTPARLFRTRAARLGADATRLDEADTRRIVSYAVRQSFYDVLLAQALRDVAAEQRAVLRQVLAADSVRLRDGDVPAQNVVRSELELARSDAAFARATAQVHAGRLALQQLMGVSSPDTGLAAAGTLRFVAVPVDTAGLQGVALRERPDLQSATTRVSQSRALVSNAHAQLVPVPQLSYVAQQHQRFANGHFYSFGVGASLPFPYLFSGERTRARAGLAAAQVLADRTRLQVETDAATALDQYEVSRGLAERYAGGLLAKARGAVETARYAYRAGAISQLELLDALRTDADTRADYYTAVHDYWLGVFAVERASGVELAGADTAAGPVASQ